MKILEFLAYLSWLLLPAFANLRPFAQLPSQSLDHPERIMEERGQLDCLGHNFQDLDILRRFEAPLCIYPEVTVGCETISVKPFRPSSQPSPDQEDPWAWVKINENNGKIPPRKANELEDKAFKYFVIDMSGVETQVGPGSAVTVETYDLSQVADSSNGPVLSAQSTRLETFTFDQLCFPSVCYRPGDTKSCINDLEWFSPEEGGSFLVACAGLSSFGCNFHMGITAELRRRFEGLSVRSVFSSNITTYCAMETSDGLLLGPLRTPSYSGLPDVLNSSSFPRTQVHSAIYKEPREWDFRKALYRTSILFSSHYINDEYKDEILITSCFVKVALDPPYNTTFAVDFFVAESRDADEKPIRPGQQVTLTSFGSRKISLQVNFEDLCFPAECYQEPPPLDDAKCQLVKARGSKYAVPGAAMLHLDPATGVNKLLWPTEGYYNKFIL